MKPSNKPNVIWILGDQHRGQALSSMGDINVHTPNLDILAVNGMNFTQARSGFPLCCPFRGSMLTGRYPHQCVPGHQYPLDPNQPTIADIFNDAGYDTAYFGKWHLDGYQEAAGRAGRHIISPARRGHFKRWLGYENNNSQWDCHVHGNIDSEEVQYQLPGYETDSLTDILLDYLDQSTDGQPFFTVLSVQPPHDPYVAPADDMQRHNPANLQLRPNVPNIPRITDQARRELAGYYAQIENLDRNVGRIVQKLHDLDLYQNTHIIFFSDHGDMHGSHGMFRKTNPYEESVRIPFIISGMQPQYDPFRTGHSDALINHVDIPVTTLGLCGIDIPDWMEGTNYASHRYTDLAAVESPDSMFMQLVIPTGHGDSAEYPWRGIVTQDGWKYVCMEGMPWLMFNLNEDPYEQVNLAHNTKFGHKKRELHHQLSDWLARTGDTFPLPQLD